MIVAMLVFILVAILIYVSWKKYQKITIAPDQARYVVGVDIGLTDEKTSITVIDAHSGEVVNEYRTSRSALDIKCFMLMIAKTYNPEFIAGDFGPHMMIADDWKREGLPVVPVRVNRESKARMAEILKYQIEKGALQIPPGIAEDDDGEMSLMLANAHELARAIESPRVYRW